MFGNINILNLFEFIAFYQLNGVNKFAFYKYNYSQIDFGNQSGTYIQTEQFVTLLSTINNVDIHDFFLPKFVNDDIHAGAQLATMHDCLFRYSHTVQIHVDIDEFVFVDKQYNSLRNWIDKQLLAPVSPIALYVSNLLHCHEFNVKKSSYYEFNHTSVNKANNSFQYETLNKFYNTLNRDNVKSTLMLPNNIFHQQTAWQHTIRSKLIILRPMLIICVGIHNVWKFDTENPIINTSGMSLFRYRYYLDIINTLSDDIKNVYLIYPQNRQLYTYQNVDPFIAVLRHYRWCCGIKQTYFFDYFDFNTLDDQVLRNEDNIITRAHNNDDTQSSFFHVGDHGGPSIKFIHDGHDSILKQMEQFVLKHFRTYLNIVNLKLTNLFPELISHNSNF